MTDHKTGTRAEWLAARLDLLGAEKELTRRSDELARQRQELPWVRIDQEYRFETSGGPASLADLFAGRSQLLIYHFMFGAGVYGRVPVLLGDRGRLRRLRRPPGQSRRHPLRGIAGPARDAAGLPAADGRSFPWASSTGSDFSHDFQAAVTTQEWESGTAEYNFAAADFRPAAARTVPVSTSSRRASSGPTGRRTGGKAPA